MNEKNITQLLDFTTPVLHDISEERKRQDNKWGSHRSLQDGKWMLILTEEIGEVAMDILNKKNRASVRNELVQCAAVCVAWIEQIDREELRSNV